MNQEPQWVPLFWSMCVFIFLSFSYIYLCFHIRIILFLSFLVFFMLNIISPYIHVLIIINCAHVHMYVCVNVLDLWCKITWWNATGVASTKPSFPLVLFFPFLVMLASSGGKVVVFIVILPEMLLLIFLYLIFLLSNWFIYKQKGLIVRWMSHQTWI